MIISICDNRSRTAAKCMYLAFLPFYHSEIDVLGEITQWIIDSSESCRFDSRPCQWRCPRHFTLLASGECPCTYCKLLWKRVSAKWLNVNVNNSSGYPDCYLHTYNKHTSHLEAHALVWYSNYCWFACCILWHLADLLLSLFTECCVSHMSAAVLMDQLPICTWLQGNTKENLATKSSDKRQI